MWKCRELLPVLDDKYIISLGEGRTPPYKCKRFSNELGLKEVYAKNETKNLIGSFKDGVFCLIFYLTSTSQSCKVNVIEIV